MTNWKCRFGFHDWRHLETVTTPAQRYRSEDGLFNIEVMSGQFHYRECARCGGWSQYYPDNLKLSRLHTVHPAPRGWTP